MFQEAVNMFTNIATSTRSVLTYETEQWMNSADYRQAMIEAALLQTSSVRDDNLVIC
jgi:hypothetical protein